MRHGLALRERCDVFYGDVLREYPARVVDRRDKQVDIVGVLVQVQQTTRDDGLVGENPEGAHEDKERHRFSHVRHVHDDLVVGEPDGGRHDANRQGPDRLGGVLGDRPDLGGVAVQVVDLVLHVEHVVGELLLRDDDLLLAVHDKITARVVPTLAHGVAHVPVKPVQDAQLGSEHDRESAQEDLLQRDGLLINLPVLAHHDKFDIHVVVDGGAVGEVAKARLVGKHVVLVVLVEDDGLAVVDFGAVLPGQVEIGLTLILLGLGVLLLHDLDRVLLSENLADAALEEIIVGF